MPLKPESGAPCKNHRIFYLVTIEFFQIILCNASEFICCMKVYILDRHLGLYSNKRTTKSEKEEDGCG